MASGNGNSNSKWNYWNPLSRWQIDKTGTGEHQQVQNQTSVFDIPLDVRINIKIKYYISRKCISKMLIPKANKISQTRVGIITGAVYDMVSFKFD